MLIKLGSQCVYYSNKFEILIFQLVCSFTCLTMLPYQKHHMVVRYGALKIGKLLKEYTMSFSVCEKVPKYMSHAKL